MLEYLLLILFLLLLATLFSFLRSAASPPRFPLDTKNQAPNEQAAAPIRAPLGICRPEYPHAPGGYIVHLRPGHTLWQHSAAVGRDMQPYVRHIFDSLYPDHIMYTGGGIDEELLDLIRRDKGVQSVREECTGRWPIDRE
jgi:hypothetical protein